MTMNLFSKTALHEFSFRSFFFPLSTSAVFLVFVHVIFVYLSFFFFFDYFLNWISIKKRWILCACTFNELFKISKTEQKRVVSLVGEGRKGYYLSTARKILFFEIDTGWCDGSELSSYYLFTLKHTKTNLIFKIYKYLKISIS